MYPNMTLYRNNYPGAFGDIKSHKFSNRKLPRIAQTSIAQPHIAQPHIAQPRITHPCITQPRITHPCK